MEALGRMLVASADLVEAEGRVLRRQAIRFLTASLLLVAAGVLAIAGFGMVIFAAFSATARLLSVPGALAVWGAAAIGAGAICFYQCRRLTD